MKWDFNVLKSKVARRILVLFVICALLPIASLTLLSFVQVSGQLYEQSRARLRQDTKSFAMSVNERLFLLESELGILATALRPQQDQSLEPERVLRRADFNERFNTIALIDGDGAHVPILGEIARRPEPSGAELEHLASGRTLVSTVGQTDDPAAVYLTMPLDPQDLSLGYLTAGVSLNYLWTGGVGDTTPGGIEVSVFDDETRLLFSSFPGSGAMRDDLLYDLLEEEPIGDFEWSYLGEDYLGSYREMGLAYYFFVPKWTVVLNQSRSDVIAPVTQFRRLFPLVTLLSLWAVLLLSIGQIRRSLVPLERLQEGTQRIANREFESRVRVSSGDEFEELADSFNFMAGQLGSQFRALTAMAEIDRSILSVLDIRKIVRTVLSHMPEVIPCDAVGLVVVNSSDHNRAQIWWRNLLWGGEPFEEDLDLRQSGVDELLAHPEGLSLVYDPGAGPAFLEPMAQQGLHGFLAVPITVQTELAAILCLGFEDEPSHSTENLELARQVVDQVAVAFSNARLILELDDLTSGALLALARAIDAKSPWTAGHSERVTSMALKIGRELGLSERELDHLQRGGLLHDIGKIGTPIEILDKPGKLTNDEMAVMRQHTTIGAQILEPIKSFEGVIPIVLQHHEWFDGSGYPHGAKGEEIDISARIFAVADVFDALVSERPYRTAMPFEKVLNIMEELSGRQFDPKVMAAFLEVVNRDHWVETLLAPEERHRADARI
jgi:putative nucleotidyltransferase with HDIG domain